MHFQSLLQNGFGEANMQKFDKQSFHNQHLLNGRGGKNGWVIHKLIHSKKGKERNEVVGYDTSLHSLLVIDKNIEMLKKEDITLKERGRD